MSSTESSSDESLGDIYVLAAEKMADGSSEAEIRIFLMGHGFGYDDACRVIAELENARGEVDDEEARELMKYGALWFIGGFLFTFISYTARDRSGAYIITWGAILYGALLYLRGGSQLRPPKE